MEKQNTKTETGKKVVLAETTAEPPVPMDQSESGAEVLEAATPAVGSLPPAAANGAAPADGEVPQPQVPEDSEEARNNSGPVLAIVDAARGLNLRSGPGREYGILAVLPGNSFVEELELMGRYPDGRLYVTEVPGWALVCPFLLPGTPAEERDDVFAGTGWVDRKFLVPVSGGRAE